MTKVLLARHAMATRFELLLYGQETGRLRAAGEEAFHEITRTEEQLSLYRPSSQVAHINARAARRPVLVAPEVFALLEQSRKLNRETEGAFDITVGPLVRAWGFQGGGGAGLLPDQIQRARERVGMDLVQLEPTTRTVRFRKEGVSLDLGAIGKGYAIDRAVEVLRGCGVTSALIHGGTSTVYGLGTQPDGAPWLVGINHPAKSADPAVACLGAIPLHDEALSVSAIWGRTVTHHQSVFGHVFDPRTAQPASQSLLAAVSVPSATEADAFSTALLAGGEEGYPLINQLRSDLRSLLVAQPAPGESGLRVFSHGMDCISSVRKEGSK